MSRDPLPSRRRLLRHAAAALLAAGTAGGLRAAPSEPSIEVWKDPNCGCCKDWIVHLQDNGLRVVSHDTGNNAVRARLGIPMEYASCHTGRVGGYAIEGHVPAREIHRLLRERPDAVGLSVPGMPVGSPGMDGPMYGDRRDPYDVMLIARDGSARVFASYR
jgi:hypothetical protein